MLADVAIWVQRSGLLVILPESAARVSTLTSTHTESFQPQLERCCFELFTFPTDETAQAMKAR